MVERLHLRTENFAIPGPSKLSDDGVVARGSGVKQETVMAGIQGITKKVAIITAVSLFMVGAVVAAVVTGIIPRTASVAKPEEATVVRQPVQAEVGIAGHKRTTDKSPAEAARVGSAPSAPSPPPCTNCGVVESVESFTEKGKATGGGAVAGGLLGGILGHQIGKGTGKDLATVAGAVGGAFAGNAIEKNAGKTVRYHIGVRMNDGTRELLTLNNPPSVTVGDHVKIVNGQPVKD